MTRAVLTFHSVDDSGSVLSFPVRAFSRMIEQLAMSGTPVVPFAELLNRSDGITITFDDGMRSVHQHALPVLRDHGFPAHIFLTTGTVGKDIGWPSEPRRYDTLNWHELEQCVAADLRVECHTLTHPDLRTLTPTAMLAECRGADDEIERRTGRRPTLLAFPYGLFNQTTIQTLAPHYQACFTTRLDYFTSTCDLSQVPRLDTYYLQSPAFRHHLLAAPTRGYIALRGAIRAIRGRA
jgi:peptidoglycan/xylan/chitin deacetylase (PgdA/CDA1 family)